MSRETPDHPVNTHNTGKTMARYALFTVGYLISATVLQGQTPSGGPHAITSESEEISLARSAAPAHVSEDATVLVLRDGRYEVVVEGTTDVTCIVARSRPGSLEPICYDAEASKTILAIEIRSNELRLAGEAREDIDREIAEAIGRGELRIPTRPAMSYMMSSGQILVSDDGRNVGAWQPHLMLYVPYITATQLGLYGDTSLEAAAVFDEGEPTAHIVIVVKNFVDPK